VTVKPFTRKKTVFYALRLILALIIAISLWGAKGGNVYANTGFAAAGRAKFQAKQYDEAIDNFRKHLRQFPKDYNVWNQLGAAYYHTGQPRKGLRYLKHVERKSIDKTYNYYYQGLCYLAVEQKQKARDYFAFIGQRYTDEYASRATFEMAVMEYKAQNKQKANYWLTTYLQRYPTGVFAGTAGRMMQSLRDNVWLPNVEGAKKPNIENALFKYNKLSYSPQPHYWFLQGGTQYSDHSGYEPNIRGGPKPKNFSTMALLANAGAGIGPHRQGDVTLFGGYTYRQEWHTEQERIARYFKKPTDLEYFPIQSDLLERRHQFYADFRRDLKLFYFGIFSRYEMARIGSSLFPSPEDDDLRRVLRISDTTLLIPWIGTSYDNMRTLAYLYMRKEINEDSPEHSNKTYELGLKGGDPVISLGVSHEMDYPDQQLSVSIEVFQYEFIYNDFWLDYKRIGGFLAAEHELVSKWFVSGLLGYYKDEYILPRVKTNSCTTTATGPDGTPAATTGELKQCPRQETGTLFQGAVYWNMNQFQRVSAQVQFVENKNPSQTEFNESKMTVEFGLTMAFPSVKRVTRFVDRYADTAFTKEAE
jgi:tetratricopeptide (TPR) repeat protein